MPRRFANDKIKTVIAALRAIVNQSSNCAFFGCLQVSQLIGGPRLAKIKEQKLNLTAAFLVDSSNYDQARDTSIVAASLPSRVHQRLRGVDSPGGGFVLEDVAAEATLPDAFRLARKVGHELQKRRPQFLDLLQLNHERLRNVDSAFALQGRTRRSSALEGAQGAGGLRTSKQTGEVSAVVRAACIDGGGGRPRLLHSARLHNEPPDGPVL